ncbi:MAG: phosphate acyltransferase PlsX [Ignavibacteriae bacterium]|nr:phosphate acyltransferase PlsX [Ignavibacteriota bacterium]
MSIAVDAMGGDFAPHNVVAGAVDALRESHGRFFLYLVGIQKRVQEELAKISQGAKVDSDIYAVINASEVIDMHDAPNAALKTKKDSSIAVGIKLHKEGKADGFVSAGNTGAVLSASTLTLGRINGIGRPTIGALIPTAASPCLLVDAGTNVDCRPRHLFEFAVMGSVYVSAMLGKENPSIGLLSIGEEESKGNEVSLEAFAMLKKSNLNFAGNVEGRDILAGKVDVVVCDGFVGNILLKFGESVPAFFKSKFKGFAAKSFVNRIVALLARNGMRSVMRELDYQEHGGVPLLGVNGVSIIGHGGSTPKAIKNMIYRAEEMVARKVNARIQQAMLRYAR